MLYMQTTKTQISLAKSKILGLQQVSVAEQAGFSHTWSQTPEDRFSRDVAHIYKHVSSSLNIFSVTKA